MQKNEALQFDTDVYYDFLNQSEILGIGRDMLM